MYKLRFTLNQIGMQMEQFKNGEWIAASVIFKPENHGGIEKLKTKILYQMVERFSVVPAGEYSEKGKTVLCV